MDQTIDFPEFNNYCRIEGLVESSIRKDAAFYCSPFIAGIYVGEI